MSDIRREVDEWSKTVGSKLSRKICPLYKEGIHRPELVGTGVLIRVAEMVFVATAAHVIEDLGNGSRYVGVMEQLLPAPTKQLKSNLGSAKTRDEDRLDLGCMVFDSTIADQIPAEDVVTLDGLDLRAPIEVSQKAKHFIAGYPATRQPRKLRSAPWQANSYSFLTRELSVDDYAITSLNRDRALLIGYDKDETYYGEEPSIGPDLNGVSGGAIWRLDGSVEVTEHRPLLTAIATTWRRNSEPKGIIGTRMRLWVHLTSRIFPEAFQRAREQMVRGAA